MVLKMKIFVRTAQIKMERKDIVSDRHFYWEKNGVWFDPAEKHVDIKSSVTPKPRRSR